jgi:methionyl-tRNA formyltransferase
MARFYQDIAALRRCIGQSPIGEPKTGVCTMLLDKGLDTGAVFLCDETEIGPDETTPELYDRLAAMGAPLVVKTIEGILAGTLKPKPQDDVAGNIRAYVEKENGFLDWTQTAKEIHNRVRAFNPWPGTVTKFPGHELQDPQNRCRAGLTKAPRIRSRFADAGRLIEAVRPPLQSKLTVVARKGAECDVR